ncbi:MAG: hypothetical protein K0S41_2354 [Anaerocolumna sp.]|nr:hypothetical protein [Anaerocolumna sp.]
MYLGIRTDEELVDFRERFNEASIHMIIHIVIWAIVNYTISTFLHKDIGYVLGLLSIIVFVLMITRKDANQHMIVYSWICLICVMACGVVIGRFIYIEILLPMMIYVCTIDVFSFSRIGKKTANAKLINSNKWLPRLLVYGRSFKTGKPVATKGFGDYLNYSIAFASIHTTYGKSIGLCAIIAIIIGVIINLLIISRIYKYKWYKGFPATIGPLGLCVILVVTIYIIN